MPAKKLTKAQEISIGTIYNKFIQAFPNTDKKKYPSTNLNWLKDHPTQVYNLVINAYSNLNSLKTHLNNLGVVLRDKLRKKKDSKKFIDQAVKFNEQQREEKLNKDDDNIMDDSCFIPVQDLINKYQELKLQYQQDPTNIRLMNKLLIVGLNTYQPPLRRNINDMVITKTIQNLSKRQNYLFVNENDNTKTRYIINNDKVSSKVNSKKFNELQLGQTARDIVLETLKNVPRKYLITQITNKDKPMSKQSYSKQIQEIFKEHGCSVSQNSLRKSYVSNLWSQNPTEKKKLETARLMRTSVNMLNEVYNQRLQQEKVVPVVLSPKVKQRAQIKPEKIEELSDEQLENMIAELNKITFDPKKYNKEYRKKNSKEIKKYFEGYYQENKFEINRKKMISRLNAGQVDKPTLSSVNKYELKYNKKSNQWF